MVKKEAQRITVAVTAIFALLASVLTLHCDAFANTTNSATLSVEVDETVLEITVPSNPAEITLTPTPAGDSFGTTTITTTVGTNNPTGYTLSMAPTNNVDNTSLIRTSLLKDESEYRTIPTLGTGSFTESTFTANAWGYSINGTSFYGIEDTITPADWTSTTPTNGTNHTLTLAAKVDATTVSGAYETTLNFIAVTNSIPATTVDDAYALAGKQKVTVSGRGYYKMQDMTSEICDAITTPTSSSDTQEAQLIDIRDNKIYWVAKLKDGKCWMAQNLDLDLVHVANDANARYTHDNTDIGWGSDDTIMSWNPTNSTIPASEVVEDDNPEGPGFSISGWAGSDNNPYSFDPGDWYWTDTWYESEINYYYAGTGDVGNPPKFQEDTPFSGNGTHGHVGNLYNWSAAVASNDTSGYTTSTYNDITGNPQNSICPKGWRLPTVFNGDNDSRDEFTYLFNKYDIDFATDRTITASPFWFVRGGYVDSLWSKTVEYMGLSGDYWTSTVSSGSGAYDMTFYSSVIYLGDYGDSRDSGEAVRCIAR